MPSFDIEDYRPDFEPDYHRRPRGCVCFAPGEAGGSCPGVEYCDGPGVDCDEDDEDEELMEELEDE